MTDRVPIEVLANGAIRYGVYNADGSLNRYEYIKLEDGATVPGMPLIKNNLLADAVATLIKTLTGTTPSTPSEALSAITSKTQSIWNGRVQIAAGTYTGTGTYGYNNQNSLPFAFTPKIVFLLTYIGPQFFPYYWGTSNIIGTTASVHASVSGNTLFWYSDDSAENQHNMSTTYYYVAIG